MRTTKIHFLTEAEFYELHDCCARAGDRSEYAGRGTMGAIFLVKNQSSGSTNQAYRYQGALALRDLAEIYPAP